MNRTVSVNLRGLKGDDCFENRYGNSKFYLSKRNTKRRSRLPKTQGDIVCKSVCGICKGRTKNKRRCTRKTCMDARFCPAHLKIYKKLMIAPSRHLRSANVNGHGLYAVRPTGAVAKDDLRAPIFDGETVIFKKGDEVDRYCGEKMSKTQVDERYDEDGEEGQGNYTMPIDENVFIDSQCAATSVAYANDYRGVRGAKTNCVPENRGDYIVFVAKNNIHHGEEILISYGRGYNFS